MSHKQFTWIPFYEAFADRLLEYKDRQHELFDIVKKMSEEERFLEYLNFQREDWWGPRDYQMDPISVLASFNRDITDDNRIRLASRYAEQFSIDAPLPQDFDGIPTINNMSSFFENGLWSIFIEGMDAADSRTLSSSFEDIFDNVLTMRGSGLASTTMGLFYARPNFFMPLDRRSQLYLSSKYSYDTRISTGHEYVSFLNRLHSDLGITIQEKSLAEISYAAFSYQEEEPPDEWWPSLHEYNPDITVEMWSEMLANDRIFGRNSKIVMKRMLDHGGQATCTQLANKYGVTKNFYNSNSVHLAKRVQKETGVSLAYHEQHDTEKWWPILYIGQGADKEDAGSYTWKLRDELREALEAYDLSDLPLYEKVKEETTPDTAESRPRIHKLNRIIYGAPGTGKTYSTIEYALAIIEHREIYKGQLTDDQRKELMATYNQYVDDKQIVFTTFHQSYGYEEFVQGIRPVSDGDVLRFKQTDGIFKGMADRAQANLDQNYVLIIDEINRGNISKIFGELITLIEEDKRWCEINQLSVTLPSGQTFKVPNNLYIIGTMNSADKSISLIDAALRRRFHFEEMIPDEELIDDEVLRGVFTKLNKNLREDFRGTDLLIGHSYFMNKSAGKLPDIMNDNIIPLLYEYYYDDEMKIRATVSKSLAEGYEINPQHHGRMKIQSKP